MIETRKGRNRQHLSAGADPLVLASLPCLADSRKAGTRNVVLAILGLAITVAGGLARSQTYRLGDDASLQRGCFPPCLCPVMESHALRGSFELAPLGCDGLFRCFKVSNVNWTCELDGHQAHITGSGVYRRGGEFAAMQQLELDLHFDDGQADHFDSGLVPGGGLFPALDISISTHHFQCWDTGIFVKAAPAAAGDIARYQARGSYESWCEPPSECSRYSQPVIGSFRLVEIDTQPLYTEYGVDQIKLEELPDQSPDPLLIRGAGTYRILSDGRQQMQLVLRVSTRGSQLWNLASPIEPPPHPFPSIDVVLRDAPHTPGASQHQRLKIHAEPTVAEGSPGAGVD